MKKICLVLLGLSLAACSIQNFPQEEFRGVWVATVVNIDWPKSGADNVEQQKEDFLKILDTYEALHFNTLIVQVRTAGDALYPSKKAPWSRYLTGEEGQPKLGFEDPLKWMIASTHERGMQFHAWFNPYRATFDLDTTLLDANHDFYQKRDWMVKYGKKNYYNPGIPSVWKHLTEVVEEVVDQYAIDGVHFDDYFYPYKIPEAIFNDSLAYQQYATQNQSLGDWRRSNVDSLVENVHQMIQRKKPWVQFGISPFGVWKNKSTDPQGSETQAGQTTYEDLYADPLVWIENQWIDYIVPQAYWSMNHPKASHQKVTEWWASRSQNTLLFMGNGPYKIRNNADKAWNKKREIPEQLAMARAMKSVRGNVFFSAKSLMGQHNDVVKYLKKKVYRSPAKVPALEKTTKPLLRPKLINVREKKDIWEVKVIHKDSVPRYLSLFETDEGGTNTLLQQTYMGKDDFEGYFSLKKKAKFKKQELGIQVQNTMGAKSDTLLFYIKEFR
ncbi:MAG: family 10 glycosylhydrolase [Bacteroidota bacterium]